MQMCKFRLLHATLAILTLLSLVCATTGRADDTEDDESYPGLVARFTAGQTTVERIDRDVQFVWGGQSPDSRLPTGPFAAQWSGSLLIRTDGQHAFHLYLQGEAKVTLNGKVVVAGTRETPGWVAGDLTKVEIGEQKIEVQYRKTAAEGLMRLFWSSETFPVEPIPAQLFFRGAQRTDLVLAARGSELFDAHRCQACHRRSGGEDPGPAPALAQAATALNRDWLTDWLGKPHRAVRAERMPEFGFSPDEARAIAEFLMRQPAGRPIEKLPDGPNGPEDVRSGEVLFRSIGCLACHTRGDEGSTAIHAGGDLTNIARKRTSHWIHQWLKEPEQLNPDHRMPVFKLTDDERRNLALFLTASAPEGFGSAEPRGDDALVAVGRKLIESARCAACHRIEGITVRTEGIAPLEKQVADWSKSCSEAGVDSRHIRPSYPLPEDDRKAIRAFVTSRAGALAPPSVFAMGERLLRQRGCLNCHDREGGSPLAKIAGATARLDSALAGQSEALIPPSLTAVGDKLRDDALTLAISGKQKGTRLPWLKVRMPRFEHSPAVATALRKYLVDHDRIPDDAPVVGAAALPGSQTVSDAIPKADLRKAGQILAGTRGFSCTACHKIASHEPRGVALATRGSDLYLIGERMRPEYFARWTRSPLRVVPGIEMPSFERPIAGILQGRVEWQLAALWEGLNDKSGLPKIDTSTIEQVVSVSPGEPAQIIRDVFNVGTPLQPQFVPRAIAIGFDNAEAVLMDLDNLAFRHHWYGDLARQRSSGKSWFWEPVVTKEVAPGWVTPDVALHRKGTPRASIVNAKKEAGRFGRLRSYARAAIPAGLPDAGALKGVKIEYSLTFDLGPAPVSVEVTELFYPTPYPEQPEYAACERMTRVGPVPPGFDAVMHIAPGTAGEPYSPPLRFDSQTRIAEWRVGYLDKKISREESKLTAMPPVRTEPVSSVPGYDGIRLALPRSIMPTAIAWTSDGTLAFCSLKGQVYLVKDTDGDGVEDQLTVFEEGLAAPYGLIADGQDLIVAHKPELLRLRDTDGDGRADVREVIADGWGYTDDYHDWTTGIVRDSQGNLYVGTGSDYAKRGRDREQGKWRGKVLRIDAQGGVTPLGHAFRYPTGLAITPDDQLFVTDNQGVQNPFNEINHLVAGSSYGVPSLFEEQPDAPVTLPAIQVPHPWTRSVNGIFFLPRDAQPPQFAGHGIGCEYDNRFLMRFTVQRVGSTYQGAAYPFSQPTPPDSREGFLGTLCGAVSPRGDIYIGSIHDSGWLGGANVGDIVRLSPNGKLPAGIREIRAGKGRFLISFTKVVDRSAAGRRANYDISGYTRKWQGSYATPDSGRHQLEISSVDVADDDLSVVLHTAPQQIGHVYEITCGKIGPAAEPALFPTAGYYTFNQVPADE